MILTKSHPAARNINNVFDELFNSFPGNVARNTNDTATVPVNIVEQENGYAIQVLAPGRNKEDFAVKVDKDLLTIQYEKKEAAENKEVKSVRREFSIGNFKRSFHLDKNINAEAIEGKYDNGILNVFLPKKEEVKIAPKQITIL